MLVGYHIILYLIRKFQEIEKDKNSPMKKSDSHLKVAYSCNDGYIMQTGISLISLLENNKEFDEITIYLVSKGISSNNIEILRNICRKYNRKLEVVEFDEIAYDLNIDQTGRHIATVYTKIFFSRIDGLDKVFYIDSDTIVPRSLKELWEIDLDGYWMGMIETNTGNVAKNKLGMKPDSAFYNDGVALCNVDYCRKNNLIEKCIEEIAKFNGNPPVLSEGIINKVCEGKILSISPRYNMMAGVYQLIKLRPEYLARKLSYSKEELISSFNNPVVIHYLSGFYNRPWNKGCTHPLRHEFIKYKSLSLWKDEPLKDSPLPKRLKIIGFLLTILGPDNFERLRKILK